MYEKGETKIPSEPSKWYIEGVLKGSFFPLSTHIGAKKLLGAHKSDVGSKPYLTCFM